MAELTPEDGVLLHTNHCLSGDLRGEVLGTSRERLATTAANLASDAGRDLAAMDRFLSDASGGRTAVQCPLLCPARVERVGGGHLCHDHHGAGGKGAFHFRRGPDGAGGFDVARV